MTYLRNEKELYEEIVLNLYEDITGLPFHKDSQWVVSDSTEYIINVGDYVEEFKEADNEGDIREYVTMLLKDGYFPLSEEDK